MASSTNTTYQTVTNVLDPATQAFRNAVFPSLGRLAGRTPTVYGAKWNPEGGNPLFNPDGTPQLDPTNNKPMFEGSFDRDPAIPLTADINKEITDANEMVRKNVGSATPGLTRGAANIDKASGMDIYGAGAGAYGKAGGLYDQAAAGRSGAAGQGQFNAATGQFERAAEGQAGLAGQGQFNAATGQFERAAAGQSGLAGRGQFNAATGMFEQAAGTDTANMYSPYAQQAQGQYGQAGNLYGQSTDALGLSSASPYLQAAGLSSAQNVGQYMNPYNEQVTNRIAELGARNLSENILPSIGSDFIKAGGYGSTRQRDLIGRAIRDSEDTTLAQQSQALQQGYGQAAQAYQADAARQAGLAGTAGNLGLGQGSLQLQAGQQIGNIGQTALQGEQADAARQLQAAQLGSQTGLGISSAGLQRGQLGLSAAQLESQNNLALLNAQAGVSENAAQRQLQGAAMSNTIGNSRMQGRQAQANSMYQAGNQFASLGNQQQTQYLRDAAALESAGAARRGVTQAGLNARTANAREREAYPWLNLNRGAALVSGAQLPSVGSQRGQTTSPGPSTAGQIAGGITVGAGLYNMFNKAKGGAVKKKPNSRVNYGGSPRRGLSMFAKAS